MVESNRKPADYYTASCGEICETIELLKTGDSSRLENAIAFLERDEYFYTSGYLKEKLWRLLRRIALNATQQHRLQKVALQYVETRWSSEFFCDVSVDELHRQRIVR